MDNGSYSDRTYNLQISVSFMSSISEEQILKVGTRITILHCWLLFRRGIEKQLMLFSNMVPISE